jgi:hypothetical protein
MFIITYLKEIILGVVGFFAFYLYNKNKNLKSENMSLKDIVSDNNKVINIQSKVLHASEDIKSTDLDSSLDRLSDKNR